MHKILILIPARYASTRFQGKHLAMIKGKSMIERVYENAKATGFDCAVVTDDDRIEECLKKIKAKVIRVDDDVPSGTERIGLAYQRNFKDYDLIINVQGDEPLLPAQEIIDLAQFHQDSDYDVATMLRKREADEDLHNPNVVKCDFDEDSHECKNFDREVFDSNSNYWFQHVGVYSYKPRVLDFYLNSKPSQNELTKRFEQLRAMDHGFRYGALITEYKSIGVDTPEDLEKVQNLF